MNRTIQLFKALSEEIRLRIIGLLADGELCVCDLMAVLDLPQSTISRHLSYLRNAGWLAGERRGVWMYYRLADDDNILRAELLPVLKKQLDTLAETTRDRTRLAEYTQTKQEAACG